MQLDSDFLDALQKAAEQRKEVETQINNLRKKLSDIEASILVSCPVKIGQKVICRGKEYVVYERKCTFYSYGTTKASLHFHLTTPRKDGTMPSKCLNGTWAHPEDLTILD